MARSRSLGDLKHLIAFEYRIERDRGDGVTVTDWKEAYRCRAGYQHLRGTETVMADRLQGQHPQVIFARICVELKAVTTAWRIRDLDSQIIFNIRDITPSENASDDRRFMDFLCQSGVST